jgi:hypothetical protein
MVAGSDGLSSSQSSDPEIWWLKVHLKNKHFVSLAADQVVVFDIE